MKFLFKQDFILLLCHFLLTFIGLFTLFSYTFDSGSSGFYFETFVDQLFFVFISIAIYLIVISIPNMYLNIWITSVAIFIVSFLTLLFTIFLAGETRGAYRWLVIGDLTIQPSEFIKVSLIFIISFLLSSIRNKDDSISKSSSSLLGQTIFWFIKYKNYFVSFLISLIFFILVFIQSSFTVSIVIFIISLSIFLSSFSNRLVSFGLTAAIGVLVISFQQIYNFHNTIKLFSFFFSSFLFLTFFSLKMVNWKYIIMSIIVSILLISIVNFSWANDSVLNESQRRRINTFFFIDCDEPERRLDECYQQSLAISSLGAGGIVGQGFGSKGERIVQEQLPDSQTDFIFSVIGYKFGFIGGTILIILYVILITRLFILSDNLDSKFGALFLTGTASMILVQFFINVGMNLGLLPVGGTTLPLVSAGGSSYIAIVLSLAISQNFIIAQKHSDTKRSVQTVLIDGWNN